MLITALDKEQRAKREAWRDNNQLKKRIAELEKERDELKTQSDVLTFENETNHECYVNLLFSNKPTEVNLQAHNLEQQAKGLIKIIKDYGVSQFSGRDQVKYVEYENIRHTIDRLQKEAKALKEQGNG
jgi:hypothetical protein